MASGSGGQIALSRIGSLYTDVNTADIWANFKSETLEHKLAELVEGSITGNHDQPPTFKGADSGGGDIVFEPNPNALTYFMKGWFGTSASSLVTAAGSTGANSISGIAGIPVNYHQFTPRVAAFSDRSFLDPHNIMIYRDVGSAWLMKGAVWPTLKFDIQAGQLLSATAGGVMARTVDRIQRTAAIQSLTPGNGRPWVWDMCSVEVSSDTTSANLAAKTVYEKLSISLSCPVEGVLLLDGTKKYGEFQKSGFRTVNIDGTMSFRDQSEYDAFKAYEARRMRLTFLHVSSALGLGNPASLDATINLGYYMLRFHLPQMIYTSWGAPISGPNRLTATFKARGQFDPTAGNLLTAEMTNLVNSTVLNAVN